MKSARFIRAALLILGAVWLSGCMFTGDNRSMVPLSKDALARLTEIGSTPAQAMMVRIYKQSSELEVWKRTTSGAYALFKTYSICKWSGAIGPKIQEGDMQAPEGFYAITPGLMNPKSAYYLSFNTGFPNKFDRAYGRTGTNLMVHGDCKSVGCYAMTDDQIKEIFALARESFSGGNASFQLEMYPFRMTPENLAKQAGNANLAFWTNLKQGYDAFAASSVPARWDVCDKKYVFNFSSPSGQPLDPEASCPVVAPSP